MAEETLKPDPVTDAPEVAAPFDSAAATLPVQPAQTDCPTKDIVMADAPFEQPAAISSSPLLNLLRSANYDDKVADMTKKKGANRKKKSSPAAIAHAPSPLPGRTGTPAQGSRAASAHPDPGFTMPAEAPPHGDSTRRYLNTKVTAVLLEGMKQLAKDKPSDPLRVLGEYLIQKSKEFEGTN
ncbi:hypothetical protein B0T10DRAFT_453733 [Thelonectria olida]|uniref:Uncharacterized protein n=1 Tax=Thelonectria olida TaxID=1576542 RepID=A0A9P9AW72_9HYPO|nr:hypothetical protein B0T10DRAFT_453733 [Thelonectria olida]